LAVHRVRSPSAGQNRAVVAFVPSAHVRIINAGVLAYASTPAAPTLDGEMRAASR
jgi:hypothetical protein